MKEQEQAFVDRGKHVKAETVRHDKKQTEEEIRAMRIASEMLGFLDDRSKELGGKPSHQLKIIQLDSSREQAQRFVDSLHLILKERGEL